MGHFGKMQQEEGRGCGIEMLYAGNCFAFAGHCISFGCVSAGQILGMLGMLGMLSLEDVSSVAVQMWGGGEGKGHYTTVAVQGDRGEEPAH